MFVDVYRRPFVFILLVGKEGANPRSGSTEDGN